MCVLNVPTSTSSIFAKMFFLEALPILNSWLMGTSLIRNCTEGIWGSSSDLMRWQSCDPFRTDLAPPIGRWKSITYSRSAFGVLPCWRRLRTGAIHMPSDFRKMFYPQKLFIGDTCVRRQFIELSTRSFNFTLIQFSMMEEI